LEPDALQWNLTPYNAMIRNYAATGGPKDDHQIQKTQRHKMPVSYDTFGDFVLMCHPVESMGHSLPLMCPKNEQILVISLKQRCFQVGTRHCPPLSARA
jgi:hypothetical protein